MNHRNPNTREEGAVLIVSLFVALMLMAAAATYFMGSYSGYQGARREAAIVRARLAADEGLERSIAEIKSGVDADGDGLGALVFAGDDSRTATVTVTDIGGGLYRLLSVGNFDGVNQSAEVMAQMLGGPGFPFNARAAITARGDVTTLGNINIDGRDHSEDGTTVTGPGVFGISTLAGIFNGGSSSVGGNGIPPADPPDATTLEANASWADGVDDDGDGATDEESWDGIDNDGDGLVDEDVNDYPSSPDTLFYQADGTLKALAQANGTYFASESDLEAYLAANGGNMPGGQVVYCDFDRWQPADFGSTLNDVPSIFVMHNAAGDALMKNVHGSFKGVLIGDHFTHLNGTFYLVGALMSFAPAAAGNAFGNGNANVLYSSEVVSGLPGDTAGGDRMRILYWRRAASN